MNDDTGPDQDSIDRLEQAKKLSGTGGATSFLQLFQNYQKSIASKPGALINPLPKPNTQAQQKPSSPPQTANKSYSSKRSSQSLVDPIGREGTTAIRKAFWDEVRLSVLSLRKIAGRNVTVTEHTGAGTVIDIADRKRPGGACFDVPSITVQISGITLGCGCVDISAAAGLTASFQNISFTGINGTFTVPQTYSGTGFFGYQLAAIGTITAFEYNGVTDCSISEGSNTWNVDLLVECDHGSDIPDGVYIELHSSTSLAVLDPFYKVVPVGSSLSGIPNGVTCGQYISDAFETNAQAIDHVGNVTITV